MVATYNFGSVYCFIYKFVCFPTKMHKFYILKGKNIAPNPCSNNQYFFSYF